MDELILLTDLAPTVLDLAAAPIPPVMQGSSLVPIIKGQPSNWRNSFLFEFSNTIEPSRLFPQEDLQGIRTDRWKYILSKDREVPEELYDLQQDPGERVNLAKDGANDGAIQQIVKRMRLSLQKAQHDTRMPSNLRINPPP